MDEGVIRMNWFIAGLIVGGTVGVLAVALVAGGGR